MENAALCVGKSSKKKVQHNLWILHTQYNLILSAGIAKNQYEDDYNHLILISDFTLSEDLEMRIRNTFDKVDVMSRSMIKGDGNRLKRELAYTEIFKRTRYLWHEKFNRVFISQDRKIETALLSKLARNVDFELINIEEDPYFNWDDALNGADAAKVYAQRKSKRSMWEKIGSVLIRMYQRVIYGKDDFEDREIYCYGMNRHFNSIYAQYPDQIRYELAGKRKYHITSEMLASGIVALYGEEHFAPKEKCVVFFFDLLERYHNLEQVKVIVEKVVCECRETGIKILCKFHPRETQRLEVLSNPIAHEVDKVIPAEKLLSDLMGTGSVIIGNTSAALTVAQKMGFSVISIAQIEGHSNRYLIDFYKNIGIRLLQSDEKIFEM